MTSNPATDARPRAGSSRRRPGQLGALWAARELLWMLALRDIRVRYKQAVLGLAWGILQPISLTAIFTVFFARFLGVPSDGVPYPLFALTGLLPWSFFASALSTGIPSLSNNAALVGKVAFPREILPLAAVVAAGADFGAAGLAYIAIALTYGIPATGYLLYVPLLLLIQVALAVGIVLVLSALNVSYRDVRHALPLLLQVWMFVTPIIYPVSAVPERLRFWYLCNPMAGLIGSYRRVVTQGVGPDPAALTLAAVGTALLLVAAYGYFKRVEGEFADII